MHISLVLCLLVLVSGCDRLNPSKPEMVYVSVSHVYLRDRVAAVSNRVADVTNGQALQVLEHGKRFVRVKTAKNEIGWIEEHSFIDAKTYDGFAELAEQHTQDPTAATATLRDDLYEHISPGRNTDHFYLIPGNSKVALLAKASVPKTSSTTVASLAKLAAPRTPAPVKGMGSKTGPATGKSAAPPASAAAAEPPPPPPMEDWWLARDAQGHTGWLLGSRVDVDVPEEIAAYGEGQRFIGAWPIATVTDAGADTPDHQVPEYLAVMAPIESGQAFDFDQVRVFTWSKRSRRYETGFRLHPIQGFLPVRIFKQSTPTGEVPAFSFQVSGSGNLVTDPATGITRPADARTIEYELIDTQVKRIGPDMAPIPSSHQAEKHTDDKKAKTGKAKGKKRK